MNKNMIIITAIIAVLVVGVGGFFGGMKYQESKVPALAMGTQMTKGENGTRMFVRGAAGNRTGGQRTAMGMTRGEVVSVDGSSIALKLPDGSSKIINLTNTTTYNKTSAGSKTDAKIGETLGVFGQTASDGSITADMISVGGEMMMGGMRGGQTGKGTQQPAQTKQQ